MKNYRGDPLTSIITDIMISAMDAANNMRMRLTATSVFVALLYDTMMYLST